MGTADSPVLSQAPSSDMLSGVTTTGDTQAINITTSGRAGTARMSAHYASGTGTPAIIAHNQYVPIILILS